jgi:hypothetical protein
MTTTKPRQFVTGTVGDSTVETAPYEEDGPRVFYSHADFSVSYTPHEARALAHLLLCAANDVEDLAP